MSAAGPLGIRPCGKIRYPCRSYSLGYGLTDGGCVVRSARHAVNRETTIGGLQGIARDSRTDAAAVAPGRRSGDMGRAGAQDIEWANWRA